MARTAVATQQTVWDCRFSRPGFRLFGVAEVQQPEKLWVCTRNGRRVGVTDPVSYTLGKTVRFVNRAGAEIQASTIRPGARVHVYYDGTGATRVVNRVVVDE